jgi:CheY-like chemotaxis protein
MTPDTHNPSPAVPAAAREPEPRSTPDVEEIVAFLDCAERPSAAGYRAATALLQRHGSGRGALFLVLRGLERLEGSLTGFVLGLESILRTSTRPVVLGDPSGLAPLILASSERDRRIRPLPVPRQPGRVLIVNGSPSAGGLLATVLEAYGRACTLVHTGIDARAALAVEPFDLILLDLDLPGLQAYAVAGLLNSQRSPAVRIAVTGSDEVWNLETAVRYGLRRILSKPYSAAEIVALTAEAAASRGF